MAVLSLTQVDEYYATQAEGLSIVGYYHANERYDDVDLGPAAKKVADKIAQYVPQAAVLLVGHNAKNLMEYIKMFILFDVFLAWAPIRPRSM